MRSDTATLPLRGAAAVVLGLSLIFGSLVLGPWGAGSSASAEEPASSFQGTVFYGYIFADSPGTLPERVRALGASGAVCGSALVLPVTDSAGFYVLPVVSSAAKAGCPGLHGVVQFTLLSGRLDDGVWAEQIATAVETPQLLHLQAASNTIAGWLGSPGNVDDGSLLRWSGSPASVSEVTSTLPFATGAVLRLDREGVFMDALPSDAVEAGDLLLVRFR